MIALEIVEERQSDRRCERVGRVPHGPEWTEGHFPGFPVVPGFVQLAWAIEAAQVLIGVEMPSRIESLKFREPLRPGDAIVLRVERVTGGAQFSLDRNGSMISSGRLLFDSAR